MRFSLQTRHLWCTEIPLTLCQWSSNGNPVAIQCTWNLDPRVPWNATWEIIVGRQCGFSVLPVVFQWFPVIFQCVPIMQINTESPLEHYWVLVNFSSGVLVWGGFNWVIPVVFQCTLQVFAGSPSGIPVYIGSTSGIPVYTGPASVHWLRVRDVHDVVCIMVIIFNWPKNVSVHHNIQLQESIA